MVSACGEPVGDSAPDKSAPIVSQAIIAGADDRIESYPFPAPEVRWQRYALSVPAMWLASTLSSDGTNGGSTTSPLSRYEAVAGQPLCRDTKFWGQPRASVGCTAFLVAPNIVATASHCLSEWGHQWSDWRLVFDYQYSNGYSSISPFSFSVRSKDVYAPVQLIAKDDGGDWALLRLDREVPAWRPILGVDESSAPSLPMFSNFIQNVATLGYGAGLPLKYSNSSAAITFGPSSFLATLDIIGGNSGGPIWNIDTGLAAGLVINEYVDDYVWDTARNCYKPTAASQTTAESSGPQYRVEGAYGSLFAHLLKPPGTRIDPVFKDALISPYPPSSVVADDGKEFVFATNETGHVYMRERLSELTFTAWTEVPGPVGLASSPVAVAIGNNITLYGMDDSGALRMNLWSRAINTWSRWDIAPTPGPLVDSPSAVVFTTRTSGGATTTVLALSIKTASQAFMKYLTAVKSSTGSITSFGNIKSSNDWVSGAYSFVSPLSTASGYSTPASPIARAIMVDTNNRLKCVQAQLASTVTPVSPPSINWSLCALQVPGSNIGFVSAGATETPWGAVLIGRSVDDVAYITYADSSGWQPLSSLGQRIFAKPSVIASLGTWWLYSLAADRRVSVY